MARRATPQESAAAASAAAEAAIRSIGLGFVVVSDVRLKYCKQRGAPDPWLIELDHGDVQDIVLPGGVTVAGVTKSVKCDKGERMRFRSDVLSFQQMSEQFNQELSLSGKIPSGFFNTIFEFSGSWQKDAANTNTGCSINLGSCRFGKVHNKIWDKYSCWSKDGWERCNLFEVTTFINLASC